MRPVRMCSGASLPSWPAPGPDDHHGTRTSSTATGERVDARAEARVLHETHDRGAAEPGGRRQADGCVLAQRQPVRSPRAPSLARDESSRASTARPWKKSKPMASQQAPFTFAAGDHAEPYGWTTRAPPPMVRSNLRRATRTA